MATGYRTEIEHVEYLEGKAQARISGRRDHGLIVGQIGFIISGCADDRGTTSFSNDAILKRGGPKRTKLIPDVSFISEEQYCRPPKGVMGRAAFLPRDRRRSHLPGRERRVPPCQVRSSPRVRIKARS